MECQHHAVHTDTICYEIHRILRKDYAFPKTPLSEQVESSDVLLRGIRSRYDFKKPHVSRGVEKVRNEKTRLYLGVKVFDERCERNTAGIRCEPRVRMEVRQDLFIQ